MCNNINSITTPNFTPNTNVLPTTGSHTCAPAHHFCSSCGRCTICGQYPNSGPCLQPQTNPYVSIPFNPYTGPIWTWEPYPITITGQTTYVGQPGDTAVYYDHLLS